MERTGRGTTYSSIVHQRMPMRFLAQHESLWRDMGQDVIINEVRRQNG